MALAASSGGGGGGGVGDHLLLTNIGTNTHAQLDTHLADATVHFTEASIDHANILSIGSNTHAQIDTHLADATVHFTEASIDHANILSIGTNSHAAIDTHIADATLHYTEGSIDHANILSIGTNSHAAIDTHIADGTLHYTEASIDHGNLAGLLVDDDHTQYFFLAGRAGGQSVIGGTAAADNLTMQANVANTGAGRILLNTPVEFGSYDSTTALYGFNYAATESFSGAFIGGGLNFSGNVTITNSTFIYESYRGAPRIITASNLGFSAYTVLQALPRFDSGSGAAHNPLQCLILNCGPSTYHLFSGTRTVGAGQAVNWAPTYRTTVSGGTLNVGTITAINSRPQWSTAAGSTVNFGAITGLLVQTPTVAPFGGSSAGTETMTSYYAVDVENIGSFGGTAPVAAVRSAIAPGVGSAFLLNDGNASSDHGAGHIYFDDNGGVAFGGVGLGVYDAWIRWDAGSSSLATQFQNTLDSIEQSSPAADRFLWDTNGGNTVSEFNFNCHKFSLGAQTGVVGNNIGAFVAGARATGVGGEWSDFINTGGANLTVDHAMGGVFGWTVNAPSMTLGTGTVTTAGAFNVGGNVNQGSVNRFGVRILSNPTGGSGINAALWVVSGRSQFDGIVTLPRNTDANRGAPGEAGRIIFNTDDGQLNIDDGTNWTLPDGTTT